MPVDLAYQLSDRFTRTTGSVYLNGVDALVRLPLDQARRDRSAGLRTEGFISGYRGSPLGTYDMALERASDRLSREGIHFEPGLNEDLAATAVWGTQQSSLLPDARVDGVFALWYGKGPGVDRSADALKHGNFAGASPNGGVLVVAGDDPGAKSSSLAHSSEHALIHCAIPVLEPSTPQEILEFGLYGWAMSRYAGCWVGLRIVTDTVESAGTVHIGTALTRSLVVPEAPSDLGRYIGWNRPGAELERLAIEARLPAVESFASSNPIGGVTFGARGARRGIVAAGKAYLDVRQALYLLGIDEAAAQKLGLVVYKVGMTWPLEPSSITAFAQDLTDLMVVEEKRPVIEDQIASILYRHDRRPRLAGKSATNGQRLLPLTGETSPDSVASAIAAWLGLPTPELRPVRRQLPILDNPTGLVRKPAFCAGCPHNTSTVPPEGSIALGGIGCHGMATYMPERNTLTLTHMGGEGANWIGMAPYTKTTHVFQNMGDGTYFHSGVLAIRAAVAAKVDMTYKILVNGAVAMTGGQKLEGHTVDSIPLVTDITRQLMAEGVDPVIVVTDEPARYNPTNLPSDIKVVHRDALQTIQEGLRHQKGVSALVYDQTCAAEARRLRKRGEFRDPGKRVVINELVCEGCGDCSVQSNCIAIEPVETEFGRKRAINQHSCNLDFSCIAGYCPSFAIVSGGKLRTSEHRNPPADLLTALPAPAIALLEEPYNIVIGGIGGTGIVTVGALIAMAAHLEGKAVTSLDLTGLSQKNGSVSSHIRIGREFQQIHARRLSAGMAHLVIGSDVVVAGEPGMLRMMRPAHTTAVVNLDVVATADFANNPDLDLHPDPLLRRIRREIGAEATFPIEARRSARELLRDELGMNLLILGFCLQKGLLPVSLEALERAIELNAVAVDMNKAALQWGRLIANGLPNELPTDWVSGRDERDEDLATLVARRADFLVGYQNANYAEIYKRFVNEVATRERQATGEIRLATAVTRSLFKLMAYKDEYEVARLYTDGAFARQIDDLFEGKVQVKLHLAPQRLFPVDPRTGRPKKVTLGPWIFLALQILRRLKFVRGTWLDVFGRTPHRRKERALIEEYRNDIAFLLDQLGPDTYNMAIELAELPQQIRGFGAVKDAAIEVAAGRRSALVAQLSADDKIGEVAR